MFSDKTFYNTCKARLRESIPYSLDAHSWRARALMFTVVLRETHIARDGANKVTLPACSSSGGKPRLAISPSQGESPPRSHRRVEGASRTRRCLLSIAGHGQVCRRHCRSRAETSDWHSDRPCVAVRNRGGNPVGTEAERVARAAASTCCHDRGKGGHRGDAGLLPKQRRPLARALVRSRARIEG